MSEASIALNRFGLGARPGEEGGASKRALLGQFERFEAQPAPIARAAASGPVRTPALPRAAGGRAARRLFRLGLDLLELGPERRQHGRAVDALGVGLLDPLGLELLLRRLHLL